MRAFARFLLTLLLLPANAHAQTRDPDFPFPDGDVNAVALHGDTLVVGGSFRNLGPNSGAFVGVDLLSGRTRPRWPRVVGKIQACVSDGSGGWYIGGLFSAVAGVRRDNLAHIRADGTLDDFNPAPDREVSALAFGAGVLYAGGDFTNVGGVPRNRLAAMNVGSGLVTPWNPGADARVHALVLHQGSVFVGGAFATVAGQSRTGLAALDPTSGVALAWVPSATPAEVFAIAARNDTILVGGTFSNMGSLPRSNVAMLSTTTSTALAWDSGADGTVYALALSGGTVYAGGDFFTVGGQSRTRLAALDLASGSATPWGQPMSNQVRSILVSGATVYVGGRFENFSSAPYYQCLVALSAATSQVVGPGLNADFTVYALAVSNGALFVGGEFQSCPLKFRNGIGAIDLKSRQVLDWDPNPNLNESAFVNALVAVGDTLYVGGSFTQMGGQARNGLAAVNLRSGAATPFAAGESGAIATLAMHHDTLYVAGAFSTFFGQPRPAAAAVDVRTGQVTGWSPNANTLLTSIVPESDAVYAAGFFSIIGGASQVGVAALDPATGGLLWPMNCNGPVRTLAKDGSTLYLGGFFGQLEGQRRPTLGAYNVVTRQLLPWNPGTSLAFDSPYVSAFALGEQRLYVGGRFMTAAGQGRLALAGFDRALGGLEPWAPLADGSEVSTLIEKDGVVYVAFSSNESASLQSFLPEFTSFPAVAVLAPAAGATLNTGSTYRLAWNASASAPGIQSVDVYLSRTGAAGPWKLLAAGAPNTGGYDWLVTGPNTAGTCFLRVDARDYLGHVVSHVSPAGFSIGTGVTAVEPPLGIASWALGPLSPNPLRAQGQFAFDAPRAAPVRIALHDVQGRVVRLLSDGIAAAGHHVVRLDKEALAPGIYLMRMQAPGVDLIQRVAVLR